MFSDVFDEDDLLLRFENAEEAFPEEVVAKRTSTRFHLPSVDSEGVAPHCRKQTEEQWSYFDFEVVSNIGLQPCKSCFSSILTHYAADPSSEVELRDGEIEDERELRPWRVDDLINVDGGTPEYRPLTALTEEVVITSSGSKVKHAPTPEGTLCGLRGEYRVVEREAVEGHYRPCEDCFHVGESSGSDADGDGDRR
jgi:hypothetical protein